jgi:predicted RNA-binding protein with RPS1 domain
VIGQRYPGKVVYTKPFGAFIDVGCHSDAFCHVSRVQDDYVESITDVLCIGQEVHARVVEVDRKAKRITVSLQSDARIEDERASVEARKQRKEKQNKGKRSSSESTPNAAAVASPPPSSDSRQQVAVPAPRPPPPMDESMMTPAELKRARKLARRAARREQQAQTGLAA